MAVTNIVDYRGYCISDSNDNCIILTTNIPIFGCGAIYARIWRVDRSTDATILTNRDPIIKCIEEL